ncbi:MAG: transporter permease [Flavisolibacter sp.]|jgi:putative ABC transport system permease protein|nr:transporter permease [Flavisolibacter sp.]
MKLSAILSLAFRTIRSNGLRSGITIAIIALGITALVGIITAIGAMNQKLTESFSTIGANGFSIRAKERNFRIGNNRQMNVKRKGEKQEKKSNLGQPITLAEAEGFVNSFHYPSQISIAGFAGNNNVVSSSLKKTNPTVALFGSDESYLDLNGFSISNGRNFTRGEVQAGQQVCLLGYDVALKLFGDDVSKAVNKEVRINNDLFRVLAVLNSKGSTFGFSRDNITLVTYKSLVRNFQFGSFSIGVKAPEIARVEEAMGEAEGALRNIRKLAVTEESNFALERNNSIAEKAIASLRYITAAVTIIGLITLIGAAIGLMNIMLVAVAERTKEVGLIKAIGGKKAAVHAQFLTEAILISLAGAVIGIVLGIVLGNLFGLLLQTNFVVPWNWILYGIVICSIVGLLAGLYPAIKAGRLNPIEALRYE